MLKRLSHIWMMEVIVHLLCFYVWQKRFVLGICCVLQLWKVTKYIYSSTIQVIYL